MNRAIGAWSCKRVVESAANNNRYTSDRHWQENREYSLCEPRWEDQLEKGRRIPSLCLDWSDRAVAPPDNDRAALNRERRKRNRQQSIPAPRHSTCPHVSQAGHLDDGNRRMLYPKQLRPSL